MVPLAFKPSAWSAAGQQFNQLRSLTAFSNGGLNTLVDITRGAFHQGNQRGLVDLFSRTLTGKNPDGWKDVFQKLSSVGGFGPGAAISDGINSIHAIGKGILTFDGRMSQVSDGPTLKERFPVLDHIW